MRYLMKQKVFSFADKYTIQSGTGEDAFVVDGKAFSFGKQLSFHDLDGRELAFIKQKVFACGPTYEIYKDGTHLATVEKEFTFFKCRFSVHMDDKDDLEAQGDLSDHEYVLNRGERAIAFISKKWFEWADTYGVEIEDGEDALLILATTVVIDLACHGNRD